MSMSDPISDMLTRIRNASNAKLPKASMPSSKMKASLAETLKDAGYIDDYSVEVLFLLGFGFYLAIVFRLVTSTSEVDAVFKNVLKIVHIK